MTNSILIIRAGSTYPELEKRIGDFDQWILQKIPSSYWIHLEICANGQSLPDWRDYAAVIISGSHSMVTQPSPWERQLMKWTDQALAGNIPMLGICYGHQLIAKVLGGGVDYLEDGPEIGWQEIRCTEQAESDVLFGIFPMHFYGFCTHHQTVLQLPPGAVDLARSSQDRHQAVRYRDRVWGVQYHPEFPEEAVQEYMLRQLEAGWSVSLDIEQSHSPDCLLYRFVDMILASEYPSVPMLEE